MSLPETSELLLAASKTCVKLEEAGYTISIEFVGGSMYEIVLYYGLQGEKSKKSFTTRDGQRANNAEALAWAKKLSEME